MRVQQKVYTEFIARAPEEVWAYLADPRNDARWRREIKHVDLVLGSPREPGSQYLETVEWQGVSSEVLLTEEESVEGRRLVVTTDGPGYRSRSSWTFEPQNRGTLVTLAFSFEADAALVLVEPMIRSLIGGWLERDLPKLQGHLWSGRYERMAAKGVR